MPEVQHHVEHRTPRAAHEFRFKRGFNLIVHTAKRPLSQAESHVRLYRGELDSLFRELACAPCPHEASAVILMRCWIDHPRTWNRSQLETHSSPFRPQSFGREFYEGISCTQTSEI